MSTVFSVEEEREMRKTVFGDSREITSPLYTHDCSHCSFVGSWQGIDVYLHSTVSSNRFILRYSNVVDDTDYWGMHHLRNDLAHADWVQTRLEYPRPLRKAVEYLQGTGTCNWKVVRYGPLVQVYSKVQAKAWHLLEST